MNKFLSKRKKGVRKCSAGRNFLGGECPGVPEAALTLLRVYGMVREHRIFGFSDRKGGNSWKIESWLWKH